MLSNSRSFLPEVSVSSLTACIFVTLTTNFCSPDSGLCKFKFKSESANNRHVGTRLINGRDP